MLRTIGTITSLSEYVRRHGCEGSHTPLDSLVDVAKAHRYFLSLGVRLQGL